MFFSVLFLDYNLQVSPRLKDRMVERDRPVSNFVMSQDICLHLSDLLALYLEKRDTFHTLSLSKERAASLDVQFCRT